MKTLMFEAFLCLMLLGFILLVVILTKYLIDHLRTAPKISLRVKVDQKPFLVVLYPNLTVCLVDQFFGCLFMEVEVVLTLKGAGDPEIVSGQGLILDLIKIISKLLGSSLVNRKVLHGNIIMISVLYDFL